MLVGQRTRFLGGHVDKALHETNVGTSGLRKRVTERKTPRFMEGAREGKSDFVPFLACVIEREKVGRTIDGREAVFCILQVQMGKHALSSVDSEYLYR